MHSALKSVYQLLNQVCDNLDQIENELPDTESEATAEEVAAVMFGEDAPPEAAHAACDQSECCQGSVPEAVTDSNDDVVGVDVECFRAANPHHPNIVAVAVVRTSDVVTARIGGVTVKIECSGIDEATFIYALLFRVAAELTIK